MFATQARVDEVSSQVHMIKENVSALIDTTAELLHGQQRIETRVKRLETGQQRLESKVGHLDSKVARLEEGQERTNGELGWVRANIRAVMSHLGVPEVEAADER